MGQALWLLLLFAVFVAILGAFILVFAVVGAVALLCAAYFYGREALATRRFNQARARERADRLANPPTGWLP